MDDIILSFAADTNTGTYRFLGDPNSSSWRRLVSAGLNRDPKAASGPIALTLPWHQCLNLFREFAPLQRSLDFRFRSDDSSRQRILQFQTELQIREAAQAGTRAVHTEAQLLAVLTERGFSRTDSLALRPFQLRDLIRLESLPAGANFSVPGAGKTAVTLALHLLTAEPADKMLVVCPKSAFTAWDTVVRTWIEPTSSYYSHGEFVNLSGLTANRVAQFFVSDHKYFVTNYEHFVALYDIYSFELASRPIHLVVDESHRMKAGLQSQRGAALLAVSNLPKRKDILTGTPMPQGPADLKSQIDFLWPGSALGNRIERGEAPRNVISALYVRTTKQELGLPPVTRHFHQVPMSEPQAALYGIVTDAVLQQLSSFRNGHGLDIVRARNSVMRLLQLASNPILAARSIVDEFHLHQHGVVAAVLQEPISPKMQAVCDLARQNAGNGLKTVVWTIFTQNIYDLENALAELNPVSLFGAVPTGEAFDEGTREGRLRRFHQDESCMVMLANPAAAGEGLSLHEVCHEAVYLDRSYVSTHYLQSLDRIHRLGLVAGQVTNVHIIQAAAPAGLGSIDYSVSRRLAMKIRALEQLLSDPDLHAIALDEESALEPIDYSVNVEDIADLIAELEGQVSFDDETGM